MREVRLRRSGDDRRRYEIGGVGWLRSAGWLTQKADAGTGAAAEPEWTFEPRGWTGGKAEALDRRSSLPVGGYHRAKALSHAGSVSWASRTYDLARTRGWRQRYLLSLDAQSVIALEVKGYGKQPVRLSISPTLADEPGLVLFTCWLCQLFAAQDAGAASSTS